MFTLVGRFSTETYRVMAPVHAQRANDEARAALIAAVLASAIEEECALEITNDWARCAQFSSCSPMTKPRREPRADSPLQNAAP